MKMKPCVERKNKVKILLRKLCPFRLDLLVVICRGEKNSKNTASQILFFKLDLLVSS